MHLGAPRQQQLDNFELAAPARVKERRVAAAILRVDIPALRRLGVELRVEKRNATCRPAPQASSGRARF